MTLLLHLKAKEHSVSPNGYVNVRKAGDYVAKLIDLAGGRYVFDDLSREDGGAQSSVNMQMEAFYAGARDADILIYNGTTDGGVFTAAQLLGKSELLADFKAVQSGNVWCTEQNLFQETTAVGAVVADLHSVFTGTAETRLKYFHRLT